MELTIEQKNEFTGYKSYSFNEMLAEEGIYKLENDNEVKFRFIIRPAKITSCNLFLFVDRECNDVQILDVNSWNNDTFIKCVGEEINLRFAE